MTKAIRWAITLAAVTSIGCSQSRQQTVSETPKPTGSVAAAPLPPAPPAAPATSPATPANIPTVAQERYRMVHAPDEIVSVLNNGAVVICKRTVGSPVLAVRAYVKAGSLYEGKLLGAGLSHLLEHLVAGGSNARYSEAQSREILQQLGNNSNAYTTDDHTAYFINTTPANLAKAADLLTSWVLYAKITEDEFGREYEVVQRELEMGKGEPARQFYMLGELNRYHVSPARVPTIGYQEVIQSIKRDDVYAYYRQAYRPNNIVFSVAGDLDPETMLATFQRFVDAPPGADFDRTIPDEPAVMSPRTLVGTMPKLADAKVSLAFPSVRLDSPDLYALDLLAAVIGQSESAPLTKEVRDKRLATSISAYSYTPSYVDGSFVVTLECAPDKLDAAIEATQLVLDKAKREPFDDAIVQRAKTQMRVAQLHTLQETANVAADLATDYVSTADIHFTDRYLERIAAVTPADLQAAARKYINNQRLIKTVMLPQDSEAAKGLPQAAQIVREAAAKATTAAATTTESFDVHRDVLDNGTILLVRRVPSSPLIAVRLYAAGGLTAEDGDRAGIGNLTMRMLQRGTTFRSANQIAEQLDAMGASVETACGNNSWYWNATFLKEDFEKGMDVFADVVNNAAFPAGELPKVRDRVLTAIASQEADWTSQAMLFFRSQYYPATSPYHYPVIGEAKIVKTLTDTDLKTWYHDKVLKSRRVLAIYGDIDPTQAKLIAAKLLGVGDKLADGAPPLPPAFEGPAVASPQVNVLRVEVKKTQQPLAGVVIGYDSRSVIGDPNSAWIDVGDTMASGWGYPTGYLHETLRGEGLVYVVMAQNWPGRSPTIPGSFIAYAGCSPDKINTVVDQMLLNIARLQGTPQDMQVDWFNRSKQLLITDEAMSNETVAQQATQAALDELWGLGYDYHKTFPDRVQKVTIEDVQKMARTRLNSCVVTICTPAPELVKQATGIRKYDSFPAVELAPKPIQHDIGSK